MNKKRYVKLFDSIKADENVVRNAVNGIYEAESQESLNVKGSSMHFRFIPIIATALVCIMLLGLFVIPKEMQVDNSFVLKAGALEMNTIDSVKIGELKGSNNALRICFDDNNKANYIVQSKVVDFPILCSGNNIEKITYTVSGNGYFALLSDVQGVSVVEYVEGVPSTFEEVQRYPYDLADTEKYSKKVISFTIDYDAQNDSIAKLCLYTVDNSGKYCDLYNENIYFEKSDGSFVHGKDFDYEQMYFELFTDGEGFDVINYSDYNIDVTVTFIDGTKETITINLGLEKTKKPYESGEDGEYTSLNVHSKVSK